MSQPASDFTCRFYRPGVPHSCRHGDECPYVHDAPAGVSRRISGEGQYNNQYYYSRGSTSSAPKFDPKYKYVKKANTSASTVTTPKVEEKSVPATTPKTPFSAESSRTQITPATSEDRRKYSKMSDLSAEDIASFEAKQFNLGAIPLLPPPRSLVH